MRILYLSRDYTTHDRRFLLKLAGSEHEIWYLRLERGPIVYEPRPIPEAVRVLSWPESGQRITTPDAVPPLVPGFSEVLARVRPDLVHAGPVQTCGYLAALAGARPLLIMSWGSDLLVDADRDDRWREATRLTLSRADWLLCDCDAVRHKARLLVPFGEDRIVQFPWGIDLDRFRPGDGRLGLRTRPGWSEARIVLSTRSWEPIYGIDVLLRAFAAAHRQDPALRLVLLGAGSLGTEVLQLIAESGLEDVVYRPGMLSNDLLPELFRSADIYLSCTHSDGTSISLLEALATGLPVVVTDNPGNREWVVPGENGWLAPAGDAAAFAAALLEAARVVGRGGNAAIARANRQVAERRADWDHNVRKLLDAYRTIEAGSREPAMSDAPDNTETETARA
jgi:glycosyltransferase involved in cell wall biosynthesis